MSRTLIILGLVIAAVGVLWPLITRLGLGRLPGDILIERPNLRVYFPLGTCLVISAVLLVLLWLFRR